MTTNTARAANLPLLHAILNLSKFHRDHEKFYASSLRELAVTMQRHARSLQALADQWAVTGPAARHRSAPTTVRKTSTARRRGAQDLRLTVGDQHVLAEDLRHTPKRTQEPRRPERTLNPHQII